MVTPGGNISTDKSFVLEIWNHSFYGLLNPSSSTEQQVVSQNVPDRPYMSENGMYLNGNISFDEIKSALLRLKDNEAEVLDEISSEIWKNEEMLYTLHSLFNLCFHTVKIPELWKCGIISPVVKSSTNYPRDPLSYRGITITSSIYKLDCNVLNNRFMKWETENSIIHDAQNGFSLTSFIDSRKFKGQSTFTAFIIFSKAYDSIDRNILFQKLQNIGLNGNTFNAIMSLYDDVKRCVRINGMKTGFFGVGCGFKQGCTLSLFYSVCM